MIIHSLSSTTSLSVFHGPSALRHNPSKIADNPSQNLVSGCHQGDWHLQHWYLANMVYMWQFVKYVVCWAYLLINETVSYRCVAVEQLRRKQGWTFRKSS